MKKIILLMIISSFLISCNTVRDSAGVNRKVMDEYSVIENPPLVIPPNFDLMPPDQIQSKNINETDEELAEQILFGLDTKNNERGTDSSVIQDIITVINADEVDDNIREEINADFAGEKSTIADEVIFENQQEFNNAIEETNKKNKLKNNEKKKKKFFFF